MREIVRALSRDGAALAVTALGLLCLLPTYVPGLPGPAVAAFNDRLSDPLMLGAVLAVVAGRAAGRGEARERRFWGLVSAGLASYLGVQAFDAFVPLGGAAGLLLQLRNFLYVGLYVFLVIALDARPHLAAPDGATAGWRPRVDAAAAIVLGLGLFAYFSVLPEVAGASASASRMLHSALLFVVFDAYLVLKTVEALRESRVRRWTATWALLLAAELSWLVADAAEGLWRSGGMPESVAQDLLNAAWLPPYLALAWAARLSAVAVPAGGEPAAAARAPGSGPLWLHAGALPVVHVLLDAAGALDRRTAGLQGVCALVVFAANAVLADLSRRRLEAGAAGFAEARRRAESAERLAFEDERTGLPSRPVALRRLEALLADGAGAGAVVALVDVDRFRSVNAVLGNAAGDELLRGAAARLRGVLRESDFLGRLWDDEFLVVAAGLGEPGDARRLGRQLLDAFGRPFRVAETEIYVTATVGVARLPAEPASVAALLRTVDGAVRRGKAAGGGRVELVEEAGAGGHAASGLPATPQGGDGAAYALLYVPVVELPGRSIVGFEARLGVRLPGGGLAALAAREASADAGAGLARATPRLLEEACRAAAGWPSSGARRLSVTVGLAPSQLLDAELPRHVRRALRRSGLEGRALVLAVPEDVAASSVDRTLRGLHELKELGVRFCIDGFGRGGCSLAALREMPVELVGIDPAFVEGLGEDDGDETGVEAVLALARSLRLVAVAGGVATERQAEALEARGCRRASGPLFGIPLPAERAAALIDRPGVHPGLH